MNKQFKRALKQLFRGVDFFAKYPRNPKNNGLRKFHLEAHEDVFRAVIRDEHGDITEVWDAPTLDLMRRIASVYPSLRRAFGPARLFVGV